MRALALLIAFCVLTPAAVIGIEALVRDRIRARRAAVTDTLDLIRDRELAYYTAHGQYLPCGDPVRARTTVDASPTAARPLAADDGDCWAELGLHDARIGEVIGGYWVEVSDDGRSFVARGICDVDADGDVAGFETTESSGVVQITDATIY